MTVSYQSKLQDDHFPVTATSCLALRDCGIIFLSILTIWGDIANKEQFPSFWDNFGHKEWAGWGRVHG